MTLTHKISFWDNASSLLFILAFIASKFHYVHVVTMPLVQYVVFNSLYILGYIAWFIVSELHPDQEAKKGEWYGFTQFKEQYLFASSIGLIASILSLTALLYVPILLIPASWGFLISNIIWATAELHKLKNPPNDDHSYSDRYQNVYLLYAISVTCISLITAINSTLMFSLPFIPIALLIITPFFIIGLVFLTFELWLNYTLKHPKEPAVASSHKRMEPSLGIQNVEDKTPTLSPPHHEIRSKKEIDEGAPSTPYSLAP